MATPVYIVATETCEVDDIKLFSDLQTAKNYIIRQRDFADYFICHYKNNEETNEFEMYDMTCPLMEEEEETQT